MSQRTRRMNREGMKRENEDMKKSEVNNRTNFMRSFHFMNARIYAGFRMMNLRIQCSGFSGSGFRFILLTQSP